MPELPDIELYLHALSARVIDQPLERVRLVSPFLLRTVDPPIEEAHGKRVTGLRRVGKQIVFELEDGLYLVLHLMIAGRLRWRQAGTSLSRKTGLAAFDFPSGTLVLTEAASQKRAALHLVRGSAALRSFERGGIEPLEADIDTFRDALRAENHTLKRSLTDPRLFSGIGNAYSDEILHRARLSPMQQSKNLTDVDIARLHAATQDVLRYWRDLLLEQVGDGFPEKVTAFRPEMAVHGKYGEPCPDCGSPVQRIRYASNECNYCPTCQTGGKLLADRSLSRVLKKDWPRTLEELEMRKGREKPD